MLLYFIRGNNKGVRTTLSKIRQFNVVKAIRKVGKARVFPEIFDVNREWRKHIKYDMMISEEKRG